MKLTGKASISLPGFGRLRSKPDATLDLGTDNKEQVPGAVGMDGWREGEPVATTVDCVINHEPSLKLKELVGFEGSVDFQTDTGVLIKVKNCIVEGQPSMSSGEVSIKFSGDGWDEV